MIDPFALEVLANPDLLPFEKPFVAAHEWAHLAGYADESEASFVGWLTCVRAGGAAQYSAWLFLYWEVSSVVRAPERTALAAALAPGPRADMAAVANASGAGSCRRCAASSWAAYDQYLKANRVDEGVRSYDAVITLLARARFNGLGAGAAPCRRQSSVSRTDVRPAAARRSRSAMACDSPPVAAAAAAEDFVHPGGVELAQRGIEPRRHGRRRPRPIPAPDARAQRRRHHVVVRQAAAPRGGRPPRPPRRPARMRSSARSGVPS